jgi:hypothetical protein
VIINERDSDRRKRLVEYQACQRRGHEAEYGLGASLICRHCHVSYKWVLEEDVTSLPTGVNVVIDGTNVAQWRETPLATHEVTPQENPNE